MCEGDFVTRLHFLHMVSPSSQRWKFSPASWCSWDLCPVQVSWNVPFCLGFVTQKYQESSCYITGVSFMFGKRTRPFRKRLLWALRTWEEGGALPVSGSTLHPLTTTEMEFLWPEPPTSWLTELRVNGGLLTQHMPLQTVLSGFPSAAGRPHLCTHHKRLAVKFMTSRQNFFAHLFNIVCSWHTHSTFETWCTFLLFIYIYFLRLCHHLLLGYEKHQRSISQKKVN